MDLDVGHVIDGKYRIVGLLGKGGMGSVYEGENVRIRRRVAIKVLHAKTADKTINVQRFEREAQAAGRIGSDHIVEVLDLGELDGGDFYMVMEFLDGENLAERFQRCGPMQAEALFPIVAELLEGLGHAHQAGIVHRDLKPDNVFLLREKKGMADFVKIVDFGVSKFRPIGPESVEMTRTGAVVGTPYYMSPEQAQGSRDIDHRTDLFAVGVILYKGLTGRVPFTAESFNQLMFKVVLEDAPSIETLVSDVDPLVVAIVKKALERKTDARYQTAQQFQAALLDWLAARGVSLDKPRLPTPQPGTLDAVNTPLPPGANLAATPKRSRTTLGIAIATLLIGMTAAVVYGLGGNETGTAAGSNTAGLSAPKAEPIETRQPTSRAAEPRGAGSSSAAAASSSTSNPSAAKSAKAKAGPRVAPQPEKVPKQPASVEPTAKLTAQPTAPPNPQPKPEPVSSGRIHRRTLD